MSREEQRKLCQKMVLVEMNLARELGNPSTQLSRWSLRAEHGIVGTITRLALLGQHAALVRIKHHLEHAIEDAKR